MPKKKQDDTEIDIHELSNYIEEFANMLKNNQDAYHRNKQMDGEFFRNQLNYLHEFENESLSYHQVAKIGINLRNLRITRRKFKNEYLRYEPIVNFLEENHGIVNKLLELSKSISNVESMIEEKKYNKRGTIDNIAEMVMNEDDELGILTEGRVQLASILKKYGQTQSTSAKVTDDGKQLAFECNVPQINLHNGKEIFTKIKYDLEKYFNIKGLNSIDKWVQVSTSDYIISYGTNQKCLSAIYEINYNDELVCRIYGMLIGPDTGPTSKKKNKKRN